MFSAYLKLAYRNLLKSPMFSGLNVLGLATGLTVSLLLFLHVKQELSFDRYNTKFDRIHRVMVNAFWDPAKPLLLSNAPNVVGPAAKEAIPAVEQYARMLKHEFGVTAFVQAGNNRITEENLYWADPGLSDIFDFQVLSGDMKAALSQPNCAALSRSTAIKYFGTANPIGQTIKIDRLDPIEIKAVYEDLPPYSSLDAHVLGAFQTIKWANQQQTWSNSSFETWLLLNSAADPAQVNSQIAALYDKNVPKEEQRISFWLMPLKDVHLGSSKTEHSNTANVGDPRQTGILGALALAVLLIACFNYMNLSTARAQLRFREVGVNKTMGASRQHLATRFFIETGVLTFCALMLALLFLVPGIPLFNRISGASLQLSQVFEPANLGAILGVTALVVLIAGSYPALFLSSFSPKNLLQTSFRPSSGAGWLRKGLVTTQFAASVALIVCTLVLYQQMTFIQQKNLGFNPEQVVAVTTAAAESKEQINAIIDGCQALSGVEAVCRSQSYPGKSWSGRSIHKTPEDADGMQLYTDRATSGIEKVLHIKLLAGTTLPDKQPGDTMVHVLLNKSAVDYLGLTPDDAIGKPVDCDLGQNAVITGVVADFHAESLHKNISGYAFHDAETEGRRFLLIRMNTADVKTTMNQVETVFKSAMPHSAFEARFLDDQMESLYRREQRTAQTVLIFSIISILISCLGLFGLAAFAAEQRTREIGVRRVLGASVAQITSLLSKDFLTLVLVAIALATPLAWYFMQRWLTDFAYHVEIQWWVFAVSGLAAIAVAFLTVGAQGVKAALTDPVKSLRSE